MSARSRFPGVLCSAALWAALGACAGRDGGVPRAPAGARDQAATEKQPRHGAESMRSFERLVGGEWCTTFTSGTSMFDRWSWGPGRNSVRVMTDGQGADGRPWREIQVFYWHPGRKQIALLGLSPFAAGVSEGTLRFDGDRAEAIMDLHQTGGLRRMRQLWTFADGERYHKALEERADSGDYTPMTRWVVVRSDRPVARGSAGADEPPFPEQLAWFASLLGHRWQGTAAREGRSSIRFESTFEWVPYSNGIYVRTTAVADGGASAHLLDLFVYHHTGRNALRALALSASGGVYEGDVRASVDEALRCDLSGYDPDNEVQVRATLEWERGGEELRSDWRVAGSGEPVVFVVRMRTPRSGR